MKQREPTPFSCHQLNLNVLVAHTRQSVAAQRELAASMGCPQKSLKKPPLALAHVFPQCPQFSLCAQIIAYYQAIYAAERAFLQQGRIAFGVIHLPLCLHNSLHLQDADTPNAQ